MCDVHCDTNHNSATRYHWRIPFHWLNLIPSTPQYKYQSDFIIQIGEQYLTGLNYHDICIALNMFIGLGCKFAVLIPGSIIIGGYTKLATHCYRGFSEAYLGTMRSPKECNVTAKKSISDTGSLDLDT